MSLVLFLCVASIVGLLTSNRYKSKRIRNLELRLADKKFEAEQLEQMILKYGQEKQETKD